MKDDKIRQFIIKLIKLTKEGELKWESDGSSKIELLNGETIMDKIYTCTLSGKKFRLYRYKFQHFIEEDSWFWTERSRMELIDEFGNTDYEFEFDNSLEDLYDIVREQSSKVFEIIDDILGLKLEIISAEYFTSEKSINVTEELKSLIKNNQLSIIANNNIAGDPHENIKKQLRVKYKYAGEEKEKVVKEKETLTLP